MAGLTTILGSPLVGGRGFRKVALMRVLVALPARQASKTELPVIVPPAFLVAILARHGGVRAL